MGDGRSSHASRLDRVVQINLSSSLLSEIDSCVSDLAMHDPEICRASLLRRLIRDGLRRLASRRHAS